MENTTNSKQRLYTLYHIRPLGHTDTSKHYVGITKNSLEFRLSQHMCSLRPVGDALRALGRDAVEIVSLGKFSHSEALQEEYKLRPQRNIGWNIIAGGDYSTVRCSGCNVKLPKRATGAMCEKCNDCRFTKGTLPHNFGTGVKAVLVCPEGHEYAPYSIHQFCKERGLVTANVRKVLKGERKHTKGWTARLLEG